MILFMIIFIPFVIYSIFAKDWLIDCLLHKDVRKYNTKSESIVNCFATWLEGIFIFTFIIGIIVFAISAVAGLVYPTAYIEYSYNLDSQEYIISDEEINIDLCTEEGIIDESKPYVKILKSIKEYPEWMKKVFLVDWFKNEAIEYYTIIIPEGNIDKTYKINLK